MRKDFKLEERIKMLRSLLKKIHLDALIVATEERKNKNLFYLSGFGGSTGVLLVTRNKVILAVDARYTQRARKESNVSVVEIPPRSKRAYKGHLTEYLAAALEKAELPAHARIGFEGEHVSVSACEVWKKIILKLLPTRYHIERMRQVKDKEEIRYLTHAAKMTSTVFDEVNTKIKAGMTEKEVAYLIDMGLRTHGASENSFPTIVASGQNSAMPHHETGERKLKAGEPVILDFGGVFEGGYCSDITRTIFVRGKKPDQKLLEIYKVVLEANKKAAKILREGVMWKDYDAAARGYIEKEGYGKYFLHGVGHSVGLEVHDPYDYDKEPFAKGTIMTNEPGIYIEGLGGVRIEDMYLVGKRGATRLTSAPYVRVTL